MFKWDVALLLILFVLTQMFLHTELVLRVFLSLDELVRQFKKPTLEGKCSVFVLAVELTDWSPSVCAYFNLIKVAFIVVSFP